jgi:hypothetical protein
MDYTRVMPVTLVEMDSLILYEEQFKTGVFNLFDLLDAYHYEVAMRAKFNNETETRQHAFRQIPFAQYIRQYALTKGIDIMFNRVDALLRNMGIT